MIPAQESLLVSCLDVDIVAAQIFFSEVRHKVEDVRVCFALYFYLIYYFSPSSERMMSLDMLQEALPLSAVHIPLAGPV